MKCETLHRLLALVPGMRLKAFLIEHHESRCRRCREVDDWTDLMRHAPPDPAEIDLWPSVKARLSDRSRSDRLSRFSPARWVLAGAAAAVFFLLIIPRLKPRHTGVERGDITRCPVIHSMSLEDKPARLMYFRVDDPGRLIVWASSPNPLHDEERLK